MKKIILVLALTVFGMLTSFMPTYGTTPLQNQIEQIISGKDAIIGVAVIVDGVDTISVNGNRQFPMLSVYKLPIAIALGDYLRKGATLLPDSITVTKNDLKENTYSPMRERYTNIDTVNVSLNELLAYALQESDNNASDILLSLLPSIKFVSESLKQYGVGDIRVSSTEDQIHQNNMLAYSNTATPLAMAKLLSRFDRDFTDEYTGKLKQLMENCTTGKNRLVKHLLNADVIVGHKTGTGFELPDGRLMAINDVGYIHLPSGHNYSIAVFIENSGYDVPTTEDFIAQISATVYNALLKLPPISK